MPNESVVALPTTMDGHIMSPGAPVWVIRLRGFGKRPRLDRICSLTWLGQDAGWVVNLERHDAIPEKSETFAIYHEEPGA